MFVGEQARDGVGGAAAVEDDGHAGLDLVGDEPGDRKFFIGVPLIAGDEIIFLGKGIRFDERCPAVVATGDAAGFEGVQDSAHRGKRAAEAGGECVEIGVFVLAQIAFDGVGALLVGHRWARGCRRSKSSR